jgi:hypothetical protein
VDSLARARRDDDHTPRSLRTFGKRHATLWAKTPFAGWPSPLFNLWLIAARAARHDPSSLAAVRGLATLKVRASAADDWKILRWDLRALRAGSHIFPF